MRVALCRKPSSVSSTFVGSVPLQILPRPAWSVLLPNPATILRWHRDLVRRKGPPTAGATSRIQGEALKLGFSDLPHGCCQDPAPHRIPPASRGQRSWSEFVRQHAAQILAGCSRHTLDMAPSLISERTYGGGLTTTTLGANRRFRWLGDPLGRDPGTGRAHYVQGEASTSATGAGARRLLRLPALAGPSSMAVDASARSQNGSVRPCNPGSRPLGACPEPLARPGRPGRSGWRRSAGLGARAGDPAHARLARLLLMLAADDCEPSEEAVLRAAAQLSRVRRAVLGWLDPRASAVRVTCIRQPTGTR